MLIAFLRDGVQDVARVWTPTLHFDAGVSRGVARVRIPHLGLAAGSYALSFMLAREGYYDRPQATYFTVNPDVYCCLTQALEIMVTGGGTVAAASAVVLAGEWTNEPAATVQPGGAR